MNHANRLRTRPYAARLCAATMLGFLLLAGPWGTTAQEQITKGVPHSVGYIDTPAYSALTDELCGLQLTRPAKLFCVKPDGSELRILDSPVPRGTAVAVSPDGKYVFYVTGDRRIRGRGVYRVNLLTGRRERFSRNFGRGPIQISPPVCADEECTVYLLAYAFDEHLWLANGKKDRLLKPNDLYMENGFHRIRMNPRHPHLIRYRRNQGRGGGGTPEVWLYDTRTDTTRELKEMYRAGHNIWSPDGNWVLGHDQAVIKGMNVFTGETKSFLNCHASFVALSPSGKRAVYFAHRDACGFPDDAVWVQDLETGDLMLVGTAEASGRFPVPTPKFFRDDDSLVWHSEASGEHQVYVAHIDKWRTDAPAPAPRQRRRPRRRPQRRPRE